MQDQLGEDVFPIADEPPATSRVTHESGATGVGNLDRVSEDEIIGWAWDPAAPNSPVDVEILDGEQVVLTVCADQYRVDVQQGGKGNGCHGFDIRGLATVFPFSWHRIRVRRASDGHDLAGSPALITRPGFDNIASQFLEQLVDTSLRVAATPADLSQPLREMVRLLGQLLNGYDALVRSQLSSHHPEIEADRQVEKRAYFIDETVPTPDQDAGSNAAVEHMRLLMELGYKVVFLAAANMGRIDPYTSALEKLGIECLYHPRYGSVEEVFRKATRGPDLVYLHRHTNANRYASMVRRYFPECRIVYNVADLHFLRMERQAAVEGDSTLAAAAAQQRRVELAAMQDVDCVIVHSPFEAKLLRDAKPGVNVEVVPWTVRPKPSQRPFAERSGIAFVGGFGHPPNLDAARYLATDIMPLLHRRLPEAKVYLVGSHMPDELAELQVPGLVPLGFVPALADILHGLRCMVVPLRYGAGIKGKVLESFAHGLPCVMSETAAEGLDLPRDLSWLVARSPAQFVEKLVGVHQYETCNRALSEAGLVYIEQRYGGNVVRRALEAVTHPRPERPSVTAE